MICLLDCFQSFGYDLVKAKQQLSNTMRHSPFGLGKPLAGLVVKTSHMMGSGETQLLFASSEVVLAIMERWLKNSNGTTKAEVSEGMAVLLGDLKALVSPVRRKQTGVPLCGSFELSNASRLD